MKIIFVLFCFIAIFPYLTSQTNLGTITSTLLTSSASNHQTVDITSVTPGNIISIQYQNNVVQLSHTFVMASFDTFYDPNNVDLSDFYNKRQSDFTGILDLTSIQLGKIQYINTVKVLGKNQLKLTIISLDPFLRLVNVAYQIDVTTQAGPSCPNCPMPSAPTNNLYCGCTNCGPGYYGPDCSINMIGITQSQTLTMSLTGPNYAFFQISRQSDISITIKISAGYAEAYFQFIRFSGQFASYSNVAVGNSIEGRFMILGGTKGTQIAASSSGTPMSITVAKYDTGTINVSIQYTKVETTNILAIILGVLGGVLFIGLVIGACYIIRNARSTEVVPSQRQIPIQNNDALSIEQIERFFPTVVLKDIFLSEGCTMQDLKVKSNQQTNGQSDCVICICPVQIQQPSKVTYCNHVFHAKCLTGWFQKQRNCPYCRQEFSKTNTIKLYKKVKQDSGKSVLKKQELVQQIMKNKSTSSKFIEQKQIANMSQLNQMSRNTIQIQQMNS